MNTKQVLYLTVLGLAILMSYEFKVFTDHYRSLESELEFIERNCK